MNKPVENSILKNSFYLLMLELHLWFDFLSEFTHKGKHKNKMKGSYQIKNNLFIGFLNIFLTVKEL